MELALELASVVGEGFHAFSLMDFILAEHFEGLSDSGTSHFEFEVFLLAVELAFDEAAEFHAVFNPHAFLMVNFHHDAVVGTDGEVGEEIVFSFEPLVHQISYIILVDHSLMLSGKNDE